MINLGFEIKVQSLRQRESPVIPVDKGHEAFTGSDRAFKNSL